MTGEDEEDDEVDDDADKDADETKDGESVSRSAWGANDRKSAQRENSTSVICMIIFSAYRDKDLLTPAAHEATY